MLRVAVGWLVDIGNQDGGSPRPKAQTRATSRRGQLQTTDARTLRAGQVIIDADIGAERREHRGRGCRLLCAGCARRVRLCQVAVENGATLSRLDRCTVTRAPLGAGSPAAAPIFRPIVTNLVRLASDTRAGAIDAIEMKNARLVGGIKVSWCTCAHAFAGDTPMVKWRTNALWSRS
jgi:hypothetical protein